MQFSIYWLISTGATTDFHNFSKNERIFVVVVVSCHCSELWRVCPTSLSIPSRGWCVRCHSAHRAARHRTGIRGRHFKSTHYFKISAAPCAKNRAPHSLARGAFLSVWKLHSQNPAVLPEEIQSPGGAEPCVPDLEPPGRRLALLPAGAVRCLVQNVALLSRTRHTATAWSWLGWSDNLFLLIPERATRSCHFRGITLSVDIAEVNHAEGKSLY